jgi:hypothetical protein
VEPTRCRSVIGWVEVPKSARPRSPRTHAPINEPARITLPGGFFAGLSLEPGPPCSATWQGGGYVMTFAEQYRVGKAPQLTGWLVAWIALLFLATVINAGTLYKTDHTPQRTVTTTQRPRVSFEVILRGPFRVLPDGTGSAPFEGRFKNSGNSVAKAVNLEFEMTARATRTGVQPGEQIYKSICDKARSNQSAMGLTLSPQTRRTGFLRPQ